MGETVSIEAAGHVVELSSPDRIYFPDAGLTKLDLARYYLDVAEHVMPHCLDRPLNLERYPRGVTAKGFVQKRVPEDRPDWLRTIEVTFGSGRTAEELCPADVAHLVWGVNLGNIAIHPWSVALPRLDEPDELRIDLDPMPDVAFAAVRDVAEVVREVCLEHGIEPAVKTSGSRGLHVIARVEHETYFHLRRAAVALSREVERRRGDIATTSWWKEERGARVFLDYNQNLWDRTMACAYSARPVADVKVSAPVTWDELGDVEPPDLTVLTIRDRLADVGDPLADYPSRVFRVDGLLELADRDEAAGLPDLPLPPHFPKFPNEPKRVAPSRAADDGSEDGSRPPR